jgi:hypothetical protein
VQKLEVNKNCLQFVFRTLFFCVTNDSLPGHARSPIPNLFEMEFKGASVEM